MKEIKSHKRRGKLPKIEVVDLFCGIGGLSFGMKTKGFSILAGFDLDATCKYAYETNNEAKFNYKDIKEVHGININKYYSKKSIKVLAGCAPCQPFLLMHSKTKRKIRISMIYYTNSVIREGSSARYYNNGKCTIPSYF